MNNQYRKNESVPKDVKKYFGGKAVHIWMAVSLEWGVPRIHCFHEFAENETVTNATFLSAMTKRNGFFNWVKRKPSATVTIDNAPGHGHARRVGRGMVIEIPDWPAKSPDLNLIENLWSMMHHHIKFHLRPTNRTELRWL